LSQKLDVKTSACAFRGKTCQVCDRLETTLDGLVDIHSHLLPGIDDGPAAIEGALDMARTAAAAGTRVIAATPHLRADFPAVDVRELSSRCDELSRAVQAAGIELRIVPGAEASLAWTLEAPDEDLAQATYGQLGRDLLVETPIDVSMLEEMLYRVRLRGVRVTLAHPERSVTFKQDPARLAALSQQGVLLQVNADALLAPRSSTTRRLAEHMCREGLAQVIASDGHRAAEWRPIGSLRLGFIALSRLVGETRATWMARDAPAAILGGEELPDPPGRERSGRAFWRRRSS
jgi:protein-tyrosine phosphatase